MRRLVRSIIAVFLSLVLAAISTALTFPNIGPAHDRLTTGALVAQVTPTPSQEGESQIGSTDGIVIMGGVIAVIILTPIFLRRKAWLYP